MAKSDKKTHEYRMHGASWILDIAKRDGIDVAEEELKIRGAKFIPFEIGRTQRIALEQSITNALYPTIITAVLGILADKYEFQKGDLEKFKQYLDDFSDILFERQSDNTPYVDIKDYERMLADEYDIQINNK